ncbi:MAG TPA: T9SS type A sorting domain-containing protein [Bacteroides sp.]|nr:T9SS type A sorting domain-containing protein [Bacteroides sp.]
MLKHTSFSILWLFLLNSWIQAQQGGSLHADLLPEIDMVVAQDGTGDYLTVQSAINAVPDYQGARTVLFIKKGTYREKVTIPSSKRNLTMIGEDADSTVIVWDDYAGRIVDGIELNTFTSQTIQIEADDFKAMNITFENDARPGGTGDGQNVAVAAYGKRNVFLHCRMIAWQDTYYSGSDDRHYLKDCFIEGAVDYIFGHTTVIFDSCQIHTVRSSGYITAASTKENYRFGYVFFNSRLTAPPGVVSVYLGRPWKTYAQTVFFECIEYENINPLGWHVWGGREETCFYAEYQCTGPGSDTTARVDWSHQLTSVQAAEYTLENIFSAASSTAFAEDWDPAVHDDPLYGIVKKHTTLFMDPVNLDAGIETLYLDGAPLSGWDPGTYEYSIEMPSADAEIPVITATAGNPLSTVLIAYPESLPGWAEITVLGNDGATHSTYRIYFSVNGSYSDTRLDSIVVAGDPIPDFDPGTFEYDVILPAGTSKYFGLTGYPHVPEARVVTTKPASFPGAATIEVTAVDGVSTSTYLLNLSLATGLEGAFPGSPVIRPVNPVTADGITFLIDPPGTSPVHVRIYDITGKLMADRVFGDPGPVAKSLRMNCSLKSGIYFYHMHSGNLQHSGKLVKH